MKNESHPIISQSYAITGGSYLGEIFVYVEETANEYCFISIPKNINRTVPKDKFHYGIANGIVEVVEKIQPKVFKLLNKQYTFNNDNGK
jgi:hypothetical protein